MPQVEIDEADLLRYKRQEGLLATALKNPSARKKLAEAVKVVSPEDPLAKEADVVDPAEKRFSDMEKALADERAAREADKAERERNEKLGSLQAQQEKGFQALRDQKWTPEGIEKVKKVMEEKGILDVEIAANWVESQTPPQNPITPAGSGAWSFVDTIPDGDSDIKKLIESKGEDNNVIHKMSSDALMEIRGVSRR